jgi:phospholipase C
MPLEPTRPADGCVKPFRIGPRAIEDLKHSKEFFLAQYQGGRMDGFMSAERRQTGKRQDLIMGHYDGRDLPYYWNLADDYVLFDRFFTSSHGGSLANHMFWVTGTPGSGDGEVVPPGGFGDLPTIFDRLQEKRISWKFYVQNYDPRITFRSSVVGDRGSQIVWVPLLNYPRYLDYPRLFKHIVPLDEFYDDARRGTLPAVSYLVPSGASEHPPGSIQAGETFVRTLLNALMRSPVWSSSAFMWTYDDWGGWYDHVRPPQVDRFGYGFRAPALLVSPWARRGHVEHSTLDFTSMLRFIEQNWSLRPLGERDRNANSIMPAFDFDQRPRRAEFLSRHRNVVAPEPPRPAAVYVAYGAALLAALAVFAAAGLLGRRRPPALRPLPAPPRSNGRPR